MDTYIFKYIRIYPGIYPGIYVYIYIQVYTYISRRRCSEYSQNMLPFETVLIPHFIRRTTCHGKSGTPMGFHYSIMFHCSMFFYVPLLNIMFHCVLLQSILRDYVLVQNIMFYCVLMFHCSRAYKIMLCSIMFYCSQAYSFPLDYLGLISSVQYFTTWGSNPSITQLFHGEIFNIIN